jgi:hypothetical protein
MGGLGGYNHAEITHPMKIGQKSLMAFRRNILYPAAGIMASVAALVFGNDFESSFRHVLEVIGSQISQNLVLFCLHASQVVLISLFLYFQYHRVREAAKKLAARDPTVEPLPDTLRLFFFQTFLRPVLSFILRIPKPQLSAEPMAKSKQAKAEKGLVKADQPATNRAKKAQPVPKAKTDAAVQVATLISTFKQFSYSWLFMELLSCLALHQDQRGARP